MGAFGLGLGIPFLLVGTFAVQLPKSGPWMLKVKSVLGAVMAVVALYYFSQLFPALTNELFFSWSWLAVAAGVAIVGLFLGAVHLDFHSHQLKERISKAFGVVLLTGGALMLVLLASAPARKLNWQKQDLQAALIQAQAEERPVLIDFSATWCGACKELDKLTFSDLEVNREAARFVSVKIDATDDTDPLVEEAMKKMEVVGLPAVILLHSDGSLNRRFDAFVPANEFLTALQSTH
jgi:thiol:disulfide interchange protein DsbD